LATRLLESDRNRYDKGLLARRRDRALALASAGNTRPCHLSEQSEIR
jgi:hypothetical protein